MLSEKAATAKDKRTGKADMQHRHFATVATILSRITCYGPDGAISTEAHKQLCERFADELAGTNPRFDRARFLAACEVAS